MEEFEQFSLWNTPKFKIDKPIRLIELFAGIGAQAKALERLKADFGVEFEHYRICEFDKYAVASYNAIHGTEFATSDITKITAEDLGIVDTDKWLYMLTYSFPCQSLSTAGKQEGMQKGSGTRSGLLWEVERLLNECTVLPQILIMENVVNIHGKKNIEHFEQWIRFLESKGYSSFWGDMNAKGFGVPQNRNRTFMVSILGDYEYEFPKPFPLELRLKDLLEDKVDKKYYLSDKMKNYILDMKNVQKGTKWQGRADNDVLNPNVAHTISVRGAGGGQRAGVSNFIIDNCDGEVRVKDLKHWLTEPLALDEQNRYIRWDGTVGTITTDGSSPKHNNRVIYDLRIRKLTPKECWRLQDFDDVDFLSAKVGSRELAEKLIAENGKLSSYLLYKKAIKHQKMSNAQLYKQSGNSICVSCLYYLIKQML